MRNFNHNKRSGGGNYGSGRRSGGYRDGGRGGFGGGRSGEGAEMHPAICSDCGNRCEVPFKPRGDKPVFCNKCFKKDNDFGSDRFNDRGNGGRNSGGRDFGRGYGVRDSFKKQMYQTKCDDCGNRCEVPFRPSGDKPVYCNDCFGGNNKGNNKASESFKEELEGIEDELYLMNEKLDKALKLLNILRPEKKVFTIEKSVDETTEDKGEKVATKEKIKKAVKASKTAKKTTKTKAKTAKSKPVKKEVKKKAPAKKK